MPSIPLKPKIHSGRKEKLLQFMSILVRQMPAFVKRELSSDCYVFNFSEAIIPHDKDYGPAGLALEMQIAKAGGPSFEPHFDPRVSLVLK
jgi:hypothetical protein